MDAPAEGRVRSEPTDPDRSWRGWRPVLWGIVAIGVATRLIQYAGNRSLWRDEAMLAANIIRRSSAELLQPLDYAQTAPAGFLLLERLAVSLFGDTEAALRLYPLLVGCLSLPLFWALARRSVPAAAVPVALLLVAISGRLIYYSSEVKQYASDVFFTILLLLTAFWVREHRLTVAPLAGLGLAGGAALWFSQPAVFVMAGVAFSLVILNAREQRWRDLVRLLAVFASWIVLGAPSLWLSLRSLDPGAAEHMQEYWWESFWPLPPRSLGELLWLPHAGHAFLVDTAGLSRYWVALLLLAAGCVWSLRRRTDTALLLLTPFLFALAASALRLYPFGTIRPLRDPFFAGNGRVLLFLLPPLFLLIAAGFAYLRGQWGRWGRVLAYSVLVLLLYPPVYAVMRDLPYDREEVRPLVAHLAEHRRSGDAIYVYSWATHPFRYYAERHGIPQEAYAFGSFYDEHPEELIRDVEAQRRPGRMWILISPDRRTYRIHHRSYLIDHLSRQGTCLETAAEREAFLYLCDFEAESAAARDEEWLR